MAACGNRHLRGWSPARESTGPASKSSLLHRKVASPLLSHCETESMQKNVRGCLLLIKTLLGEVRRGWCERSSFINVDSHSSRRCAAKLTFLTCSHMDRLLPV